MLETQLFGFLYALVNADACKYTEPSCRLDERVWKTLEADDPVGRKTWAPLRIVDTKLLAHDLSVEEFDGPDGDTRDDEHIQAAAKALRLPSSSVIDLRRSKVAIASLFST